MFVLESLSPLQVSKVKHAGNLLWGCRVTLFMDVIIMPMSFLVFCFVNDETPVVDHELCRYSMCFFLDRIANLSSFPVFRLWYLLFRAIGERQKAWEILFSLFSGVLSLCDNLCIFCGIGTHSLTSGSIFCMSLQMLLWSRSNKKPANV